MKNYNDVVGTVHLCWLPSTTASWPPVITASMSSITCGSRWSASSVIQPLSLVVLGHHLLSITDHLFHPIIFAGQPLVSSNHCRRPVAGHHRWSTTKIVQKGIVVISPIFASFLYKSNRPLVSELYKLCPFDDSSLSGFPNICYKFQYVSHNVGLKKKLKLTNLLMFHLEHLEH